jgi:hypothetical protein
MENHLKVATHLANLLDNQFNIFGIRFGMNGIIGLIPGVGDFLVAVLSFYMVWIGLRMGLPLSALTEMIGNIAVNFFIGLLPVVGDAVDFFHKANLKNLKILKDHAKAHVVEGEIVDSTKQISYR